MNRDEFWAIVESVGWADDHDYERGKQVLLAALPTIDDMRAYDERMLAVDNELSAALEDWEKITGKQFPCGDDSFSDLKAHIIGLGRPEFERNVAKPKLAYKRANDHKYAESFSYCTPDRSDYDATRIQLARATSGLEHWQDQLVDGDTMGCAASEVRRRSQEVEALRERLEAEGGTEMTPEEYEAHLNPPQKRVQVTLTETIVRTQTVWVTINETATDEQVQNFAINESRFGYKADERWTRVSDAIETEILCK